MEKKTFIDFKKIHKKKKDKKLDHIKIEIIFIDAKNMNKSYKL